MCQDRPYMVLLPGGQYARGWGRSLSTRRRISLWLQGSLFFTANGSYFDLLLSVCQQGRPDRWGVSIRQACLHGCTSLPVCKGVSLGKATNFLIYSFSHLQIRSIRLIRGRKKSKGRVFILVYRLGEDGDLLQGRWWYAFGLGVKSSLL